MNQIALDFSPARRRARRGDPSTSHDAAVRVADFAASHYGRIHAALAEPGTIYEIADRCGMSHVQVARRLPERPDLFARTGERRDGCGVWKRVE